jgi:hypothetical protein
MTHAELVARAARWLRNTEQCRLVLTEYIVTYSQEQPDALGWMNRWDDGHIRCINVECKTSRSDFLRDQDKFHRRAGKCIGSRRWYMAPAGIIRPDDLPAGWGLCEVVGAKVRRTVEAPEIPASTRNFDSELNILISAAQGKSETWLRNMREAMSTPAYDLLIDGVSP